MKNGFKETLDEILRKYGMKTQGTVGTVLSYGDYMWLTVNAMGYRVEKGIDQSNYDYVILSEKKSTLENIVLSLSKVDFGCIVIFRFDNCGSGLNFDTINYLGEFDAFEYKTDKYLGVLLKRKENK